MYFRPFDFSPAHYQAYVDVSNAAHTAIARNVGAFRSCDDSVSPF